MKHSNATLALLCALGFACAGKSYPWPVTANDVQKAPASIAALRVWVSEARVVEVGSTGDDEVGERAFAQALKEAATKAGLTVVRYRLEAYDYEIRAKYTVDEDWGRWGVYINSAYGWTSRWNATEQPTYDRLYIAATERCGFKSDPRNNVPEAQGGGSYWLTHPSQSADHRRAATAILNAWTSCPENAKMAEFVGSHGWLASGVKVDDSAGGAAAPTQAAAPSSPRTAAPVRSGDLTTAAPQPGAYAFIIGVERYRDVPAATGARSDAERFAALVRKTLGLKDEHVRVAIEDHATRSDVIAGLEWLKQNVSAGGRVYFFFSGHGAPAADQSTYLLPYDGIPKDIANSAVSMTEVMKRLGETQAKEVLAIVDACFSGAGGRSVLPAGARPLMRVKEAPPAAQIALFTASQGDEISGPAPGENAGVFTKYVTQGLGTGQADANGDGQISLQELSDWVSPRVARDAKKDNRDQHPKLVLGSGVAGGAQSFIVEYGLATK